MIKTIDLIAWARDNAVRRTLNNPEGWIISADLEAVAEAVRDHEPFDYNPPRSRKEDAT